MLERIEDAVLPLLATAAVEFDDETSLGARCVDILDHLGGDFTSMVEDAVTAFRESRDGASGLVKAASVRSMVEEGRRELALHAHDGCAHPLAYILLHGVIAPEDDEEGH